jgi:hypothetical protein
LWELAAKSQYSTFFELRYCRKFLGAQCAGAPEKSANRFAGRMKMPHEYSNASHFGGLFKKIRGLLTIWNLKNG